MHEKGYVHTRVQPASVLIHGNRRAYLSRLMKVQMCTEKKKVEGKIPSGAKQYFFLSPERYRQNVDKDVVFDDNMAPDVVAAKTKKLFPAEDEWDPKADDVWGFGCTVWFALTGKYPFKNEHALPRQLLKAHKDGVLIEQIQENQVLTDEQRDFLLWVLQPQRDRPTMDQILKH